MQIYDFEGNQAIQINGNMFLTDTLTSTDFPLETLQLQDAAGKVQEKFLGGNPALLLVAANWTGNLINKKTKHKSGVGNQVFKNL